MRLAKISSINKKKGMANVVFIQTQITSFKLPIISYILPELKVNDLVLVADTEDNYSVIIGKIFNDEYTPKDYEKEHEEFYKKLLEKLHPEIDKKQFAQISGAKCKNYEGK